VTREERGGEVAVKRFAKDVAYGVAVDLTKTVVLFIGGSVLAAVALLIWQGGSVPAWVAALAVLLAVVISLAYRGRSVRALRGQVRDIERARDDRDEEADIYADALVRYEVYTGHVAQALDALQRIVSQDIDVPIPHYIEVGVLEPARDFIIDKPAEQVRLSVLLPDDDGVRWWMPWAAGHSVTGKAKYNERIIDTLSRHAYETGEVQRWDDVTTDSSFRQNPMASHPTRSMISRPLRRGDDIVGVFNVVSSEPNAFDPAEETYIASLGAVIAVAVGVFLKEHEARPGGSD
jgi:hypothetical protein